jgi:3-deoxy-D-manno-octulosonate 8-phosphate phosphatase (KDO 8-P phosphatase)
MSKERASKIKILLLDVDGVMTDGTIYLFPAPAGAARTLTEATQGKADEGGFAIASEGYLEAKGFNAHDGTAFSLARLGGLKTGVITKRISETVRLRARDLKLDHVYQGVHDKLTAFNEILAKEGLTAEQAAFVGDDIIDLPPMRAAGFAVAVANAREEVKDEAHIVTDRKGGDGAVRDTVEYILKAQGSFDRVLEAYIGQRSPQRVEK